jgi:glyoxylase-like metal-dependent hydrolase (beta-lactamase superfamily II)
MGFEVTRIGTAMGNAYLIKGNHIALVDTRAPFGRHLLLKGLEKADVGIGDIEYILITHSHMDHAGNAAMIKELSGAQVIAGAPDVPCIEGREDRWKSGVSKSAQVLDKLPGAVLEMYMKFKPFTVDRTVSDGDVIEELGLQVVATPGHTDGGVTYWDREGGRAFIGDMMSYIMHRPGMPSLAASQSLEEIFASQEKLASLGLDTAYPGHGEIIRPDASAIIADYSAKMSRKYTCA